MLSMIQSAKSQVWMKSLESGCGLFILRLSDVSDAENSIVCNNFQACCITDYEDITPGSELSEHPSNVQVHNIIINRLDSVSKF